MARKITPTHVLLNQIELSSSAFSVTFSNIPQGYGDLVLVCEARSTRSAADDNLFLKFNDSSTGYSHVRMVGRSTPNSAVNITGTSENNLGQIVAASGASGVFTVVTCSVFDYSLNDKHKTTLTRASGVSTEDGVGAFAGRWGSSSAVNSIQLYPDIGSFVGSSVFSLYGVYA